MEFICQKSIEVYPLSLNSGISDHQHPQATSLLPSSDASLSHDHRTSTLEKKHITEQSPVPDRNGHDGQSEVVGLQEGNAGVVSGSQDHSTGQCEDDPSPAATASNSNKPVDDLQAPLPRDTETPPIQEKQDEHSEVIRPLEENQETTYEAVATVPLQSSSQNYGIKQHEDYSPVIPSRDESASDPVPKKSEHIEEHSLMRKRSSEDEHSERISPPPVTQAHQHDPSKDGKLLPPYKTETNATTTSSAQPVDDIQTHVPKETGHITEQSPLLEEQSQEPPTEDHVAGETTTAVVASEPLQPPSTCHGPREHQDSHNPGVSYMPSSSEESVDDPVPKEKRHVTESSPLLEEYSQDACSEVIMPPSKTQLHGSQCNSTTSIDKEASPHLRLKKSQEKSQEAVTESQALEDTISDVAAAESPSQSDGIGQDDQISSVSHDSSNVKRHITKESPILEESKGACHEAVTADQLGSHEVTQSQDKGQINTDVVMNNNVMPTTCPLPLPTTAQDMQDGLQSPQKRFYSVCEPETEENEVDDAESITSDFQQQLHGSLAPVQSEDIVHNTNTGATADMMPQGTAISAAFACRPVPHIPHDNVCEPVTTIPIQEAPVMVSI